MEQIPVVSSPVGFIWPSPLPLHTARIKTTKWYQSSLMIIDIDNWNKIVWLKERFVSEFEASACYCYWLSSSDKSLNSIQPHCLFPIFLLCWGLSPWSFSLTLDCASLWISPHPPPFVFVRGIFLLISKLHAEPYIKPKSSQFRVPKPTQPVINPRVSNSYRF